MASFLGQSGNALSFLNPAGQQVQVDPNSVDASTLEDLLKYKSPSQAAGDVAETGAILARGGHTPNELPPEIAQSMYEQQAKGTLQPYLTASGEMYKPEGSQVGAGEGQLSVAQPTGGIFNTGSPVGQHMDPSMVAQMQPFQEAFKLEQSGIQKEAKGGIQAAKEQRDIMNEILDPDSEYQRRQRAGMQAADDIRRNLEDKTNKYESMVNDYMKSSAIDPNRIWNNANTGGKIMAGISMLLGGLGAGLAGGPNQGIAMIDKMVDRDIDAQKAELEKKRTGMGMQQNLVGMMRSQLGDNEAAMLAAKRVALDNVEMQMKKTMAGLQGTQAEANGMKALGEIGLKKAQLDMELKQKLSGMAAIDSINSGGGQITPRAAMMLPKEVQDRLVKVGSDSMAMAVNPKAATDLQERLPDYEQTQRYASDLLGLVKEGGVAVPFTEKKAKAEQLIGDLTLKIKDINKFRNLTDTDMRLVHEILGDPTAVFSRNNQVKLEQFLKNLELDRKKFINQNTLGYRPEMPVEKRNLSIPAEKR
jgi:hypothetical protein